MHPQYRLNLNLNVLKEKRESVETVIKISLTINTAIYIGPGANLRGADLTGANFQKMNLSNADLRDANLQGASLEMANLKDANLQGASLKDVKFSSTIMPDGSK